MSTKVIEGYEDYFVSDQGEVFSKKYGVMEKLKQGKVGGYSRVSIHSKQFLVHRLVAQAFVPNPKNKPCVNHLDGNKQNNCAENLEWATYEENSQYFQNVQKPLGQYDSSEESNARKRRYYADNRDELNARKRRYYADNRDELNARVRRYRAAHPEKMKAYYERYKAKKDALKND